MTGITTHSFNPIPITSHSWNQNGDMVALSHNNNEVQVYKKQGTSYGNVATLGQHDLRVTGISWAPISNRIVTCSADHNAYVWSYDKEAGIWNHTPVFLRCNRAITCIKWSPNEQKIAAGSGARIVNICHFNEDQDWWVAKHIKKQIYSTVTCLDWHPNNVLVAVGSTDFKVRVFSAYVKDIEPKPSTTPWGAKMPFSTLMAEFSNSLNGGGWVHDVSFSADGNKLAWIGHDSSVSVADANKGMAIFKLKTAALPLLSCIWISDSSFVAAGHDCVPLLFNVDTGGQVKYISRLEEDKKAETNTVFSAKALFKQKDRTGQTDAIETILNTTHQKQISCIRIYKGDKSKSEVISTTAGDGMLVLWDVEACKKTLKL
ncbi:actin-related protein 2/3 complex subunit 1A-A [Lepeophtheirus salmonis]|uniref:Actin-related protein 2/3 complex subunit n=3 Tax=Lepeophtheirus salmonis TaxID=72036 RepID=C1BTZ0_LEPSM|nr:actin-related protein 2/3 complex subunit 1A-A-like [Lepeophtheirus salmonis]ACO12493.1 Actin-related protein 2/3 complex subunit 1A [Lepeophtheirus salmonis]